MAKKNKIILFYQIFSDMKNNINTLIKDLYEHKDNLEEYTQYKSTVLKSKFPDLKKLGILEKTDVWKITDIGKKLLELYEKKDEESMKIMIGNIIGTYNYNGFRPYAVFAKFLYIKYGVNNKMDSNEIAEYLSLPVNEAIYFINNQEKSRYSGGIITKQEAKRPLSYAFNMLENAGLIMKVGSSLKLTYNVKNFLEIFFQDIDIIPKSKHEKCYSKYRIVSRGSNQRAFRAELIKAYRGRCAITGKTFTMKGNNLLEAAHIIPVSLGGSYDVTNGILMTPDLHQIFDAGAITFDDQYNIEIFKEVTSKDYLPESLKINYLPEEKEKYPSVISIQYHRKHIFGVGIKRSRKAIKIRG